MSWCTVESDPGVFTSLIQQIGVKGVQVEELYDLDVENLKKLQPVYGLIFLFKWQSDAVDDRPYEEEIPGVFFAKQMINNACATQAIMNVLLNRSDLDLGDELRNFKQFTQELPSEMRGFALGNSELIRLAHNSFARPEPFVFEEKKDESGGDDDAFHFIGFVPVNGVLYELDGLKAGPIRIAECSDADSDWLNAATQAIQQRVQRYAAKEIRFNLLALVQDRQVLYRTQLETIQQQKAAIQQQLNEIGSGTGTGTGTATHMASPAETNPQELQTKLLLLVEQSKDVERLYLDEKLKYERWSIENVRRKHNYVPFIFNLLKILAEKGKLNGLVEQAAKVTAERNARQAAKKQKTTQ